MRLQPADLRSVLQEKLCTEQLRMALDDGQVQTDALVGPLAMGPLHTALQQVVAWARTHPSYATDVGAHGAGNALPTQAGPAQPVAPRRPAHCLWAVLLARIDELSPLLCPICGGQTRIIAFITHSADIRHTLEYIGAMPSHRASHPHAGRRSGMVPMRKPVRALSQPKR